MTENERQEALRKCFDEVYKEDIATVRQIAAECHSKGEYDKHRALNWVCNAAEKYMKTSEWKNAEVHYIS